MKSDCGHGLYWYNCYKDSYDLIAPDSYAHPAKMSPALCFNILQHLDELGLLKPSDTVLDPMAGTGLTNICAGAKGYKSISVELEDKFIGFQKQNKDYAERKLFKKLDWQIIQGDSRKLSELLSERGLVTVYPLTNYAHHDTIVMEVQNESSQETGCNKRPEIISNQHSAQRGISETVPERIIGGTLHSSRNESVRGSIISENTSAESKPSIEKEGNTKQTSGRTRPYEVQGVQGRETDPPISQDREREMLQMLGGGESFDTSQRPRPLQQQPEQSGRALSELPPESTQDSQPSGNQEQLSDRVGKVNTPLKAITSPPYGDSLNEKKNTTSNLKREERLITAGHQPKEFMGGTARNAAVEDGLRYSENPDNLGNLPDKSLKAVMSPPYDGGTGHGGNPTELDSKKGITSWVREQYGDSNGQIENKPGESYLSAMLQVYQEIAKVSDVLAIVIKNPTRNKQLRRLDLDTIKILELAGWRIHCQHRSVLFEELDQSDLFGETKKKVKGRMSFFKRLSWQNGQPVASWEDVIISVRQQVIL